MASASSPDTLAVSPLNAPPSKTKLMPSSEAEYEPTRDPDRQEQIYLLTEQDDEEAASHRIIEDYVREEGLYAASRDFRVDLYDFVRDESSERTAAPFAEHWPGRPIATDLCLPRPLSPVDDMVHVATETSRTDRDHDDESMSSDAPSSAASSVRFIVATPMPDVPSAWKAAFAFQMTSTPSVKSHIAAQVPCTAAATNVGDTRPGHRTSPEQKALASPRLPAIMVIRTPESSEASSSSVPSTAESSFSSQVEAIASKCLPYSKTTHLAKTAHLKQIGGPRLATLSPVPGTGGKQAILIVAPPPPPPRSEAPSSPSPSTRSQASPKSRVSLLANESIDSSGPISASSTFSLSVQQPTSREKDPSEPVHQSLESERNQAPLAAEPQSGTSVKATRQPGTAPLGGADSTKRSFRLPSLYPATAADSRPLHKTVVLRLTNVPWTVTVTELTKWMGLEFSKAVLPSTVQIVSVHICCDRYGHSILLWSCCMTRAIDGKAAAQVQRENSRSSLRGAVQRESGIRSRQREERKDDERQRDQSERRNTKRTDGNGKINSTNQNVPLDHHSKDQFIYSGLGRSFRHGQLQILAVPKERPYYRITRSKG